MQHYFDIEIARKYGVNEAIFLNNLSFWIIYNKANGINLHNGRYWSFNNMIAFLALFPYWSLKTLRTTIESVINQNLVITGNFNKRKSDRTLWYSLTDLGLSLYPSIGKVDLSLIKDDVDLPKTANETGRGFQGDDFPQTRMVEHLPKTAKPFAENGTALPDINKDNKQKIRERGAKKECASSSLSLNDFLPNKDNQELLQKAVQRSGRPENDLMTKFKALMETKEIDSKHWQSRLAIFLINEKPSSQSAGVFTNERQQETRSYGNLRDFTQERLDREREAGNNKRLN